MTRMLTRDLFAVANFLVMILLHCALDSGAVYCNRSRLCVCVCVCLWRAGGACYHDNSKLRASIFTEKVGGLSPVLKMGDLSPFPPCSDAYDRASSL